MIWCIGLAMASPELVTTEVWTSSFDQMGARPRVHQAEGDLAFEVAVMHGDTTGLRIYLEESPGEPYVGPLTVDVDGLEVFFRRPTSPRSTPDATIYEAELSGQTPRQVLLLDGPQEGAELSVPVERSWAWMALLLVPIGVLIARLGAVWKPR
ncbi:MAG: hypothetical protein GY913_06765 [Proteobacteria bacterium]|nr:hypothetical protein [Pseudomonadota bacterium]MCP4916608.1 hypothetical protein [Pseudomonadota bacterium]